MLDGIRRHYFCPTPGRVVHNGRTPALFDPSRLKDDFVLSVGRVWDAAKQVSLLLTREMPTRVNIVGWEHEPGREGAMPAVTTFGKVEVMGPKSQAELQQLYAGAAIYAGTSRYEPFGLSPLEAALSRCALVLNDNPVFRELWGDAAIFFQKNDGGSLVSVIQALRNNTALRDEYAERAYLRATDKFSAERMLDEYEGIYQSVTAGMKVA
jgi:glycosyltransferase involved in cell wall biosynthesis